MLDLGLSIHLMEALPSIDNLAGPFLVQPLIACTLFGITFVQSRTYFEHCANDPRLVIAAVSARDARE